MENTHLFRSIRLENILSFGPGNGEFPLGPLNVLIGPNASGKSNLIEALSLLAAAPRDLHAPIRDGGGIRDWLWKGERGLVLAKLDVTISNPIKPAMALRYRMAFSEEGSRFALIDEAVENADAYPGHVEPYFYYRYEEGQPVLNVRQAEKEGGRFERRLLSEEVSPDQSILSQRKDPYAYPELTYISNQFERIRFYREWNLGRNTSPRVPQKADLPEDSLLESASNLGLVINNLQNRPDIKRQLLDSLQGFYESVTDVVTKIQGGTVQIFFHEKGLKDPVPATRLSDGTLRFLCLLAILLHPEPPPVVCIEEPELGLHPDIIPQVAKLLVDASARSQLFVTTHSDILVDALTETPEAVIVCEKVDGATQLRRLDAEKLKPWLAKYRLGELWISGEIGGKRW